MASADKQLIALCETQLKTSLVGLLGRLGNLTGLALPMTVCAPEAPSFSNNLL